MSGGEQFDIAVSHAPEDYGAASRLAEELASHGWLVFAGRTLPESGGAKVVIVLWSSNSAASRQVEREAEQAFRRDAYVPVRLDACPVPAALGHVQVTDLVAWYRSPAQILPDALIHALARRLRSTVAGMSTEQRVARTRPRLVPVIDDEATALADDRVVKLSGTVPGGMHYELSVHLSQLRAKPAGLVIGRVTGQCDLVLAHASVSRRHALLRVGEGRLLLSDLGSTNGTTVNSVSATSDGLELSRGAVVRMGDVELIVDGIGQ
jgi:hypothetical protein